MGEVLTFRPLPIVPEFPNYGECLAWFRSLSTTSLKRMWDSEDYDVHCDEIHRVMNERGEGHYVAV